MIKQNFKKDQIRSDKSEQAYNISINKFLVSLLIFLPNQN
jgi:hypothetical protein